MHVACGRTRLPIRDVQLKLTLSCDSPIAANELRDPGDIRKLAKGQCTARNVINR